MATRGHLQMSDQWDPTMRSTVLTVSRSEPIPPGRQGCTGHRLCRWAAGGALLREVGRAAALAFERGKGLEGWAGEAEAVTRARGRGSGVEEACGRRRARFFSRSGSRRFGATRGRRACVRGPTLGGGAAAGARAHASLSRGGAGAVLAAWRPSSAARAPTLLRRSPARPHVPRAVRIPLGGAQRAGVRRRRDFPGAGAQQRALVAGGAGAQWRDGLRAARLPAPPAGECAPPRRATASPRLGRIAGS